MEGRTITISVSGPHGLIVKTISRFEDVGWQVRTHTLLYSAPSPQPSVRNQFPEPTAAVLVTMFDPTGACKIPDLSSLPLPVA